MKSPKKQGFFDSLLGSKRDSVSKPVRDDCPNEKTGFFDSMLGSKKPSSRKTSKLLVEAIDTKIEASSEKEVLVNPAVLHGTLHDFYSQIVAPQEDIKQLLDEAKDLLYWGALEEIPKEEIAEKISPESRFPESREIIENLYRDNAEHVWLMSIDCSFKGFPTYEQYRNICKLTLEKVHTLEAKEKHKQKESYTEDMLFNYRYGYKGKIRGIVFEPFAISSIEISILEKNNYSNSWEDYVRLLDAITKVVNALGNRDREERNALYNLEVLQTRIDLGKFTVLSKDFTIDRNDPYMSYGREGARKKNEFRTSIEYWNYLKSNNFYVLKVPKNAGKRWKELCTFEPIKSEFIDTRYDYILKLKSLKFTSRLHNKIRTKSGKNAILPRKEQESHTYIVGGTKSGKSELLKFLTVQEILKGNRNSVLFDPHGDIAQQISNIGFLYPNHVRNIIYVDTSIKEELGGNHSNLPCINPLEVNKKYINTREKLEGIAYYLSIAFEEIIGAENSVNMRAMLIPCLCVLLEREDSTLYDLDRFMNDDENDDLVQLGAQSENRSHASYFQTKFRTKKTQSTKEALAIRLQVALNSTVFAKMTCGRTTLDFHEIVRGQNTHVIFRLNKENTASIQRELGILIITTIMNAAFTTKESERQGMHLLIDEFQNFINSDMEKILSECRKYRVYLTLAHQYLDQIYDIKIRKAILANTNIKIIGSVGGNTVKSLQANGEMRLEQEFVDNLRTGKFLMRIKSQGAFYDYLNVPSTLVSNVVKWIDKKTKLEFLKNQYHKYYKATNSKKVSVSVASTNDDIDFSDF